MLLLYDVIDSLSCLLLSATSLDISSQSCDDLVVKVISCGVSDAAAISIDVLGAADSGSVVMFRLL